MPHFLAGRELASEIANRPCPLLFLDTCSILDVLRVPIRRELQIEILNAVATMTKFCDSTPRRIWLVTSALVISEFETNVAEVKNELKASIEMQARLTHVARVIFPDQRVEATNWGALGLDQRVTTLVNGLVDRLVVFDGSPKSKLRAGARVTSAEPPSGRGKDQQYKDCVIFEAFLELVSAARSQGFKSRAIFVTADKGYGKQPGHPRIKRDLDAVSAEYVPDLAWAWGIVRSDVDPAAIQPNHPS